MEEVTQFQALGIGLAIFVVGWIIGSLRAVASMQRLYRRPLLNKLTEMVNTGLTQANSEYRVMIYGQGGEINVGIASAESWDKAQEKIKRSHPPTPR